jgi:endonuclease/exonuclease/phosphatase family metal-dependent hydrolase
MCAFKVLQFNMQYGQNWSDADPDHGPINLDLTIAEIRSHDADIVLLQEVEQANPGGAQSDPPPNFSRLRAELDGYDAYFSYPKADPRELPFGIGLAIFARGRLFDAMHRDLPSPAVEFDFNGEKRTPTDRLLIGAKTEVDGRTLQLYNTHLLAFFMINSSSEEYTSQRRHVVDQLCGTPGPTLLGGDFNVSRHDSLVQQFGQIGYRTVQDAQATWRRRPYVLDHLFFNRYLRLLCHEVHETQASDHRALVADFEFV